MTQHRILSSKVAMIREEGYQIGQPAPMYLNCPCGAKPVTTTEGPDILCSCGVTYSAFGWVLHRSRGTEPDFTVDPDDPTHPGWER